MCKQRIHNGLDLTYHYCRKHAQRWSMRTCSTGAGRETHEEVLAGTWDIELVYNDSKENGWVCNNSVACWFPCAA